MMSNSRPPLRDEDGDPVFDLNQSDENADWLNHAMPQATADDLAAHVEIGLDHDAPGIILVARLAQQQPWAQGRAEFHHGPGPHESGTSQDVHGLAHLRSLTPDLAGIPGEQMPDYYSRLNTVNGSKSVASLQGMALDWYHLYNEAPKGPLAAQYKTLALAAMTRADKLRKTTASFEGDPNEVATKTLEQLSGLKGKAAADLLGAYYGHGLNQGMTYKQITSQLDSAWAKLGKPDAAAKAKAQQDALDKAKAEKEAQDKALQQQQATAQKAQQEAQAAAEKAQQALAAKAKAKAEKDAATAKAKADAEAAKAAELAAQPKPPATPDDLFMANASKPLKVLSDLMPHPSDVETYEVEIPEVAGTAIFRTGSDARRYNAGAEIAVYETSKALGFDVVPLTAAGQLNGKVGAVQRKVNGRNGFEITGDETDALVSSNRDRFEQMMVLDAVTGNAHRPAGAVMFDTNGKVWAVNSGRAMASMNTDLDRLVSNSFADRFKNKNGFNYNPSEGVLYLSDHMRESLQSFVANWGTHQTQIAKAVSKASAYGVYKRAEQLLEDGYLEVYE